MRGSVECHTYWPTGGSPDGDGVVVTANGPGGCLLLVRAGPVAGGVLRWRAICCREPRDVAFVSGRLIVSEGEDPLAAVVRTFVIAPAPPEDAAACLADIARREADPDAPAFARWAFFSKTCGRVTPGFAHRGATGWLRDLDQAYGMHRVDEALSEHPVIGDALRTGCSDSYDDPRVRTLMSRCASRRDRIEAVAGLLSLAPGCVPFLARLMSLWAGRHPPVSLIDALESASAVPIDWIPADREGMLAMVEINGTARLLSRASTGSLSVQDLIAPVHGRWTAYRDSLLRLLGEAALYPREICSDVADGIAAFREDVVDPMRALARDTVGSDPAGCSVATAWLALHGGRGLAAVLEGSRDWHARASTIHDAVSSLGNLSGQRWPTPFQAFVADGGHVVTPMVSASELVEEGKRQSHCVSTYAPRCAKGACAVAAIGMPGAEPLQRSTAELRTADGRTVVVQHRGLSNREPPPGNVAALEQAVAAIDAAGGLALIGNGRPGFRLAGNGRPSFRESVRCSMVPETLRNLSYDPRVPGSVELAVAAWSRHLRRDLRDPYAVLALGDSAAAEALRGRASGVRTPRAPILRRILRVPGEIVRFVASEGTAIIGVVLAAELALIFLPLMVWIIDLADTFVSPARIETRVFKMLLGQELLDKIPVHTFFWCVVFVLTLFVTYFVTRGEKQRRESMVAEAVARRRRMREETGPLAT